MAIAIVGSTTSSSTTVASTLTFSHTTGAGTDMLVVTVGIGDSDLGTRTVDAVTFGGVALTFLASSAADDGSFVRSEIWYKKSPAITTANIVVDFGVGAPGKVGAGATSFSGVEQVTTFGTPSVSSGNSTTASTVVSSAAGELVIAAIGSDAAVITPTGSQLWEVENIGSDVSAAGQTYSGAASVTAQWGQGSTDGWAVSGVALKPAAGGGGRTTKNTRANPLGMDIGMAWRM